VASGRIHDFGNRKIYYIASSPADHRANFSGSGIPFANANQAFQNSPNIGESELDINGGFSIPLLTPNSFMMNLGSIRIPPTIYIKYMSTSGDWKVVPFKVSEGIPYRSMTYSPLRKSVQFYNTNCVLNVRSQERILREAGYPGLNVMPKNHWGVKPPV
jgi:hypothetical protein